MSNVIEQAAREYADVAKSYLLGEEMELVRNAFEAGAEWALANQWHEINKELPKETENVLVLFERQIPIIGKVDSEIIKESNITHWCEIPPFEEKQPKK
ncbi:hypothetical protein QP580_03670 [Prevotella bivia]|uniref:hypothetical protein n=1 Tax=Prevotella bivia TaxID=28125 RepID=UPI00254B66BC|nr:hypothetical protein [Prevotella bivia]MDK7762554.1 hypothetical protein [Prevotella bivia]